MTRHVDKPRTIKISHQVLNQFIVSLTRNEDMTVNFETSQLIYTVADILENGVEVDRREKRIAAYLWPDELLAEIKTIYDRLVADADKSGYFDAGQERDDLVKPEPKKIVVPGGNGSPA